MTCIHMHPLSLSLSPTMQNGPGIDRNTTGMELAPVSNTETEYREVRVREGG